MAGVAGCHFGSARLYKPRKSSIREAGGCSVISASKERVERAAVMGVCGKDTRTAALQDLLIHAIRAL